MTNRTDPSLDLLHALWTAGWEFSPCGWAWMTQCPTCGTDLVDPALDLLVDHAMDHARAAHPLG